MAPAKISIIGEAWGEEEEAERFPFVGVSGIELLNMLHDAGLITLSREDRFSIYSNWNFPPQRRAATRAIWEKLPFHTTNVFNLHPVKNDIETLCVPKKEDSSGLPALRAGKYIAAEHLHHIDRLFEELKLISPTLILALGATASWALLHDSRISKIRGTVAASTDGHYKVIPIYHPTAVLRQWDLRAVTVLDLIKAKSEAQFKEIRRPERTIYIEPSLSDIEWFYKTHVLPSPIIAPDIETFADQITCIGFATATNVAFVIPFVDHRKPGSSYWPTLQSEVAAWEWVRKILASPAKKVFQNGLYDISFLWRGYGIPVVNADEDTMLLHHALQPESPKGLDFLGSVYTNEQSWKLMRARGKTTIKRDE